MTDAPALRLDAATLWLGRRLLWDQIALTVPHGEFLAVLGPNGSGKTSLLRSLLGLQPLTSGWLQVLGRPPLRGNPLLGYVPQQRAFDPDLALRGRDLVALGVDGHRWGWSLPSRATARKLDEMLSAVDAQRYAGRPIGRLSGGEQQRLRVAQALIGHPRILLCDEPLLSLDPNYQQAIVELISDWTRRHGTTVVFVTHDINPVLHAVDRILLLGGGRWAVGHPDAVLTQKTLSQVYGAHVDVLRARGRVVVLGVDFGGHELLPEVPHAVR